MSPEIFLQQWQQQPLPLVAILRGITPEEAEPVAEILLDCGFRFLEVPLNSPTPYDSIRVIRKTVGDRGFVGAGTVLNVQQVEEVAKAGGQLIISPNTDAAVIGHSRYLNLISMPAVATPSEAFCALAAGASGLKLFPAESITPAVTKALRVVLPQRLGQQRVWAGRRTLSTRHQPGGITSTRAGLSGRLATLRGIAIYPLRRCRCLSKNKYNALN
ncbi:MAG: hypothetical protein E7G96_08180 [Serratia liquefaciens]|nr:hypothetical protein [Serratia liquefaciens]